MTLPQLGYASIGRKSQRVSVIISFFDSTVDPREPSLSRLPRQPASIEIEHRLSIVHYASTPTTVLWFFRTCHSARGTPIASPFVAIEEQLSLGPKKLHIGAKGVWRPIEGEEDIRRLYKYSLNLTTTKECSLLMHNEHPRICLSAKELHILPEFGQCKQSKALIILDPCLVSIPRGSWWLGIVMA